MDEDQPQPSSYSPPAAPSLCPCPPPKPGQIRHLALRTKEWQKQPRRRRLLQPYALEDDSVVSYVLEKELHTNPMTGGTIILATPVRSVSLPYAQWVSGSRPTAKLLGQGILGSWGFALHDDQMPLS